jgi:hypothetical protein
VFRYFASMNPFWILKCTSKVHSPRMRVWWNVSEPGSRVKLAEPDSRARLVRVWAPCNSEPSPTEGPGEPSRTRPSPARGAPYTDEIGSLGPEPSRTREPDSYVYGRLAIASRAPPKALASQAELGRARLVAPHTQSSLAH